MEYSELALTTERTNHTTITRNDEHNNLTCWSVSHLLCEKQYGPPPINKAWWASLKKKRMMGLLHRITQCLRTNGAMKSCVVGPWGASWLRTRTCSKQIWTEFGAAAPGPNLPPGICMWCNISVSLVKINPISNLYYHAKCPYQYSLEHSTSTFNYLFMQSVNINIH
jgi:hypothetical protein